jgi:hypothetical protein
LLFPSLLGALVTPIALSTHVSSVSVPATRYLSLPAQLALVSRSPWVAEYRDGVLVQLYPDGDDSH